MRTQPIKIHIWHNILWSKYKGEIFSALWAMADKSEFWLDFTQIAETDRHRVVLSEVDLGHHRYPFEILFSGVFSDLSLLRRVRAILARTLHSDADLFILSGYERLDCWLQLLVLKLRGRKIALFLDSTVNDRPQHLLRGVFKRIFLRSVDGVFGYGIRTKEYAVGLGARPERVFIPCQAAALAPDYSPQRALQLRVNAEISPAAPRFLYVGRLADEKGLETLLEAFGRVRERIPAATLTLVGDGALRATLEARAAALAGTGAVKFTGSKSGPALTAEFVRATALILPSMSEPWGLVVNEALSHGCPAIVSDRCGCVPELVIEGVTGLQHRAGSAESLAEKMCLAPAAFADCDRTARHCLELIAHYTPGRAAHEILEGCRRILDS